MPPPKPASGDAYVVRIWIGHHYCMSILACQYNQPKRPGDLDLLTLKVVSLSRVMWATSVPIFVFLAISVPELSPMYATDRRQTKASLMPLPIRGGGIINHCSGTSGLGVFNENLAYLVPWYC